MVLGVPLPTQALPPWRKAAAEWAVGPWVGCGEGLGVIIAQGRQEQPRPSCLQHHPWAAAQCLPVPGCFLRAQNKSCL